MSEGAPASGHTQTIWHVGHLATRARRQDLLAAFVQRHGYVVQEGLFAGMVLSARPCWGDGDLLPKLLGFYEEELHASLKGLLAATPPDLIVNVGAAEGFYAVGLARLAPEARVHAFEATDSAHDICRETARLNEVEARVSVAGRCTTEILQHLLSRGERPLLVLDCEGCERELLDPTLVTALGKAAIIVECHDFIDPSITQVLVDRLGPSHELSGVREGPRDPNRSAFLQPLDSLDRWLAVCEYRPRMMHWLIAKPKGPADRR